MKEPPKLAETSREIAEDLNLSAIKAFHQLLEADKTLLPAWRDAALRLSERDVPQDIAELRSLLQGEGDADSKTTQS